VAPKFSEWRNKEVKQMRNPLVNGKKFKSPCNYSRISNPLVNSGKAKRVLKRHDELLRQAGIRPLKNPLV